MSLIEIFEKSVADRFDGDRLVEIKSQVPRDKKKFKVAPREITQMNKYANIIKTKETGIYYDGGVLNEVGPFVGVDYFCNHKGVAEAFKEEIDASDLKGKAKVYLNKREI